MNAYQVEDFKGNSEMKNGVITLYFKRSPASRAQHAVEKCLYWFVMLVSDADLHISCSITVTRLKVKLSELVDIVASGYTIRRRYSRTSILSISSMSAD